jgi:uncharacterized membrane protein YeaQ/YmgE (transglycosylase-associated protein family)
MTVRHVGTEVRREKRPVPSRGQHDPRQGSLPVTWGPRRAHARPERDVLGSGAAGQMTGRYDMQLVRAGHGSLANLVMGSRQGLLMMVVLGFVGGLVGGFVATSVLKIGSVNGINLESILIASLGAIAVVFVVGFVTRPRGLLHR